MRFYCSRHPDREAVLVAGLNYCQECLRALDREVITEWCHHAKPELTGAKALQILEEMFQTKDFGFSSFPKLYQRWARETQKAYGKTEFVKPQMNYIQDAFLDFTEDEDVTTQGTVLL
jgi:hypothetical protein